MPMYEAKCRHCGKQETYFASIANRNETPECCRFARMERIISMPMVNFDIAPWQSFESPADGKIITSRSELKENLARNGKILYEPGLKQDIARNLDQAKDAAFRPIEAAVDSLVTSMVASGQIAS